jgi:hypothetical protein
VRHEITSLNSVARSQLKVKLTAVFTHDEVAQYELLLVLRDEVIAHTDYTRKPVSRFEGTVWGFSMDVHQFELLEQGVDIGMAKRMCEKLEAY